MGDVLEEESLFSLELFAETLSISGVPCRFPALAFRLLDYPTLIIHHVEPDLADTIRTKIAADPHYKLGTFITELQDKHGNFVVKKGKSCLFKTTARHLCDHLSATPLYVMLIDTYPEAPKLLGSFGIPLDSCIDKICKDIEKLGIATPSTHGEKCDYKIYNLMGALVGRVTMGFRLLSLGQGLLAHIPSNAIAKPKATSKVDQKDTLETKKASSEVTDNLKLLTKDVQVSLPSARPTMQNQEVQTAHNKSIETAMQSDAKSQMKKPKLQKVPKKVPSELDDVIVTNVECPPPLFYNSRAAEPDLEHYTYGLTLSDNFEGVAKDRKNSAKDQDQNSSESDEDTIRQEDKLDDSDTDDWVDFKASRIYKSEKDYYPPRAAHSFHRTIIRGGGSSIVPKTPVHSLPRTGHFTGLPILNALLQEILALQEMQTQPTKRKQSVTDQRRHSVTDGAAAPKKVLQNNQQSQASPRPPTPLISPTPGRHPHHACASHEPPVPKNKSWLRSQPSLGVKKSKLTYGLTNTQRLRLAKANPELLKEMEEKEALRLQNRKQKGKEEQGSTGQRETEAIDQKTEKDAPTTPTDGRTPSETKSPRPPKPTPRLSRQLTKEPLLPDVPSKPSLSRQPSISRSESPLPRTKNRDATDVSYGGASDEDDASDSYYSAAGIGPLGNTRTIHKNPMKDIVQESPAYLDELGASATAASAEVLGLQKMVDRYSDVEESNEEHKEYSDDHPDESNYEDDLFADSGLEPELRRVLGANSDEEEIESPLPTGYEPPLRKVVDQYSDTDDAQSPIATGYGSSLRNVVDQYSDSESASTSKTHSQSFSSAREKLLVEKEPNLSRSTDLNKTTTLGHPTASRNSPIPANKTSDFGTTRTGLDLSNEYDTRDSPNSTAYISRSQVLSETGTSLDSTGEFRKRPPKPSPRRKIEKMSSIHTDSLSSYAPSEPENISPDIGLDEDVYSDDFEDNDSVRNQDMRDLTVPANVKLGYTWT